MPMSRHYRPIALLVMIALLLQPMLQAFALASVAPLWLHSFVVDTAKAQSADQVYLPIITKGGSSTPMPTATPTPTPSSTPVTPPSFIIMAPTAGSTVAGTINFAIQPLNAISITSVSFQVGGTQMGVDNTPNDGFRVFVNAKTLAAGNQQFTATATGPSGSVTQSVTVNVVPNPPSAATIGNQGGVLATTRGSVISILPNSVAAGAAVTVTELTQSQVQLQNGINWEKIGVTFLGAQQIDSTAPFSRPLGMVASAGFGNRVQPGQAVVNYRIAPDADGDGVDEIVVVNTASVAPNGDVLSDPLQQITQGEQNLEGQIHLLNDKDVPISGTPGKLIEVKTKGLNVYSFTGNRAKFRSLVNNTEVVVAAQVDFAPDDAQAQIFRVGIPYLPVGGAILTIQNSSTGYESNPISIQINPLPPLTKPAKVIFEEYFQKYTTVLDETRVKLDQNSQLKTLTDDYISDATANITTARTSMQEAFLFLETTPISTVQHFLDDAAKMIEVSEILVSFPAQRHLSTRNDGCTPPENLSDEQIKKGAMSIIPIPLFVTPAFGENIKLSDTIIELASSAAEDKGYGILATIINTANSAWKIVSFSKMLTDNITDHLDYVNNQAQGKCDDEPPPAPNPGGNNGSSGSNNAGGGSIIGMGSAPLPGGNGFGVIASGRTSARLRITGQPQQQTDRTLVKIFSNGFVTPFTAIIDSGGYFFIPFIPQDEPFIAVAYDTGTGETRKFKGIGPKIGKSVFMFFDFFRPIPPDITVTNLSDSGAGSLRQAVANSFFGEHIQFAISGTLTLANPIVITKSIFIDGPGSDQLTISGNNLTRTFEIATGATVRLARLRITNGRATNGGGIYNSGDLTIIDSVLAQNTATESGGAIYTFNNIFTRGKLTLQNSSVISNIVENGGGGGIFNCCDSAWNDTTLIIEKSTIMSNTSKLSGGGIFVGRMTDFMLVDSIVANNRTIDEGGWGGGIIFFGTGSHTITNSLITANFAAGRGGGISSYADITLINSTVSYNMAASNGGGISNAGPTGYRLTLIGSTISNNKAIDGNGGGIYDPIELHAINSTIVNNHAAKQQNFIGGIGGGIAINNDLNLLFTTIAGNHADEACGGVGRSLPHNPNHTWKASIIAGNSAPANPDYCPGSETNLISLGYNIVGGGTGTGFVNGVNNDQVGVDPLLKPLANNGGNTPTIGLQPSSPAINKIPPTNCTDQNGKAVTSDQRGVARPQEGACDVGAYEYP